MNKYIEKMNKLIDEINNPIIEINVNKNENYEVILGKIYKNNIIENKDYLILDDNKTKNKHSIVI